VLRQDFVGGRASPQAENPQEGIVSYFKGDPANWRTAIPTHNRIVYRDLWPGIDLVYASGQKLKYEFVVHPGAHPGDIRLRWRGATNLSITPDGSLRVTTPAGTLEDEAPTSFQGAARVETAFELSGTSVGFRIGAYDATRTLVIDPTIIVYSGFIGGDATDAGDGIAVDATGAAYVTGRVDSTQASFPETIGPDLEHNGGSDTFIAKVSPSGSLVHVGYFGGSQQDIPRDVAVDSSGAAYLTGYTTSTEAQGFPVVGGPDPTYNGGPFDAFVAKVAPSGASLVYSGYIGGLGDDGAYGIAVDPTGAAYVTGYTDSDASTFPVMSGPSLTLGAGGDAFVTKVAPSGALLVYSGYIGGDGLDYTRGITVDAAGNAYVVGEASSTEVTFPETMGPDLIHNGAEDAFVAKVSPSGTSLVYAGFIGGSLFDSAYDVAVDATGAAYVGGYTESGEATFPETVGPDLTHNGGNDAFVAKVVPSGSSLQYAGYLGGADTDVATAIAIDASGAAYLAGRTRSTEATFPETVGPDLTYNGISDAFVAKVGPSGLSLVFAGYVGGADFDYANDMELGPSGAVLTGYTLSTELSFPVAVGPDLTINGLTDAFVTALDVVCLGNSITIAGTESNDVITGTSANDVILALGGDDTIDGGAGNDTICAGDGNDTLIGRTGDDKLDGEAGTDTASFPGSTPVTVDLATGTASGSSIDTLAGIENVTGSSGADVLKGDANRNVLRGGAGKDRLVGAGGDDELLGQTGADTVLGGSGNDIAKGGAGADALQGQSGNDRLIGRGGPDRLSGGAGRDVASGGGGNDRLSGGAAKDNLSGGGGFDHLIGGKGAKDRCAGGKGNGDTAARSCEVVTGVP
jgi:Ca2+-binding RTX toxin-like protein